MSAKSTISISVWVPFVAAVLISVIVAETTWSLRSYSILMSSLGILNVIFAVRVLRHTGLRLWPILAVIVGLVIGQFRIIEAAAMILLWSLGGFAP